MITGLPRSRTAWLAVAASGDESVCWHEPTEWLDRWQDVFTRIWGIGGQRYVGASDSALGFHLPEILERMPMPVVIVDRAMAEVEASVASIGFGGSNFCALLTTALKYQHPSIMRVPFGALSSNQMVAKCLQHLMPDATVNMDRLRMLQRLNVQTDLRRVRQAALRRAGDISAILGPEVAARLVAA